jgi:deoxyadenosine/deoxycytidine kinase
MMPKIISIEGNIGAGKTTILSKLQEKYANDKTVIFIKEPVDVWEQICDASGENILQKFYADSTKYAFPFQVMAYITRYSALATAIRENPDCRIIICERSLDADCQIFAKMLFDDGIIEDVCYQIYKKIYDEYSGIHPVTGYVYIDADAEICSQRIGKRGRGGEAAIPLEYLAKCKKYHDKWLLQSNKVERVLYLNTNEDVNYDNDMGNLWIDRISEFMED